MLSLFVQIGNKQEEDEFGDFKVTCRPMSMSP